MRPQLIAVEEEVMQPPPQGKFVQVGQVTVKTMHQRILHLVHIFALMHIHMMMQLDAKCET